MDQLWLLEKELLSDLKRLNEYVDEIDKQIENLTREKEAIKESFKESADIINEGLNDISLLYTLLNNEEKYLVYYSERIIKYLSTIFFYQKFHAPVTEEIYKILIDKYRYCKCSVKVKYTKYFSDNINTPDKGNSFEIKLYNCPFPDASKAIIKESVRKELFCDDFICSYQPKESSLFSDGSHCIFTYDEDIVILELR